MRCPVRVHNGGNRAKPPQTGKAYRPTTADRRTVLCTRVQSSAAVVSDHSLIRDWISRRPAQDARASRDDPSSPTSATKSAQSGHWPRVTKGIAPRPHSDIFLNAGTGPHDGGKPWSGGNS